jgi:hypothetical protein
MCRGIQICCQAVKMHIHSVVCNFLSFLIYLCKFTVGADFVAIFVMAKSHESELNRYQMHCCV